MKYKICIIVLLAGLCYSCTDSSGIDTPRKYEPVGNPEEIELTYQITLNGQPQEMMLLKDRYQVMIIDTDPMFIKSEMEFQNQEAWNDLHIKSLNFRCGYQEVDGNMYSLSGSPEEENNQNASKIVLYVPGQGLITLIPVKTTGNENNMLLRFEKSSQDKIITGEMYFRTTTFNMTDTIEIKAKLAIRLP